MKHTLYNSVDAMLAPETLSALTGNSVNTVHIAPADFSGLSGSHLSVVETNQGEGTRYVLKRILPERDWVMRTTDDQLVRRQNK